MPRVAGKKSSSLSVGGFGDFVFSHRDEILQSWIGAIEKNPTISSDNLTRGQLLDHLPALCGELAALLKHPKAKSVKKEARRDARAHGWKRWRQGYKLDELIREICVVRRDFIDTWLPSLGATDKFSDVDRQSRARRIVEVFFDNVIVEATVQFVRENQQTVLQVHPRERSNKKSRASAKHKFVRLISHQMREPLAPLLLALDFLLLRESFSVEGIDIVRSIQSGIKKEAQAIEDLLGLVDSILAENENR